MDGVRFIYRGRSIWLCPVDLFPTITGYTLLFEAGQCVELQFKFDKSIIWKQNKLLK